MCFGSYFLHNMDIGRSSPIALQTRTLMPSLLNEGYWSSDYFWTLKKTYQILGKKKTMKNPLKNQPHYSKNTSAWPLAGICMAEFLVYDSIEGIFKKNMNYKAVQYIAYLSSDCEHFEITDYYFYGFEIISERIIPQKNLTMKKHGWDRKQYLFLLQNVLEISFYFLISRFLEV